MGDSLLDFDNGHEFFIASVDLGMTGSGAGAVASMVSFEIDGDEAIGTLDGLDGFRFERNDRWEMDLQFTMETVTGDEFWRSFVGDPSATNQEVLEIVALSVASDWEELSRPPR